MPQHTSHAGHFVSRHNNQTGASAASGTEGTGTELSSEALQALTTALVKEFGTSVQSVTQPDGSTIHTFADGSQANTSHGKAVVLQPSAEDSDEPSDEESDEDEPDSDE